MKTIGFPISLKENENRRAILPKDIKAFTHNKYIYIEKGYGDILGIDDKDYAEIGCNICDRSIVLSQDIICDPKIGDAEYLSQLSEGQIIFGWIHAVQNRSITDQIINAKLTGIAWEDMYYKGRHIFWRNNEIAGEAAIMHAFLLHGLFPYETNVAIIGRGNIARGALKILTSLGANVTIYDRYTEKLIAEELENYDVLVNAILWDTKRDDHIVYKTDLKKMKAGALIIDISCDRHGAIETTIPTTITDPIYQIEKVVHYAVDHTPSLFYKSISNSLSTIVAEYLPQLLSSSYEDIINNALIIKDGVILDQRINDFQKRN